FQIGKGLSIGDLQKGRPDPSLELTTLGVKVQIKLLALPLKIFTQLVHGILQGLRDDALGDGLVLDPYGTKAVFIAFQYGRSQRGLYVGCFHQSTISLSSMMPRRRARASQFIRASSWRSSTLSLSS